MSLIKTKYIEDNAVTTSKILDNNVTNQKLEDPPKIIFKAHGYLRIKTGIDPYIAKKNYTILNVSMFRDNSGTSGSTTIDINKNGATIFTTQANRPSIVFSSGDNQTVVATPGITSISQGDIITFDIDVVEEGYIEQQVFIILEVI